MSAEGSPIVLPAVSRGIARTLVDGTIRVTIDIDPGYGLLAMQLLGMPGSPIAIAGLNALPSPADQNGPQATRAHAPAESHVPRLDRPAGGSLARSAALLANEPGFQAFCAKLDEEGVVSITPELERGTVEFAAAVTRAFCMIASRAELDSDVTARVRFRELMGRYREFTD